MKKMRLSKTRELLIEEFTKSLDEDIVPWRLPWNTAEREPFLNTNYSTGKPYRGINMFALSYFGQLRHYVSSEWLTYNQMKKLGYHFRKNDKGESLAQGAGIPIEVYKPWDSKNHVELTFEQYNKILKGKDEERKKEIHVIIKNYTVFNADLVEEISRDRKEEMDRLSRNVIVVPENAENVLRDHAKAEGISIIEEDHMNQAAYYNPEFDRVVVPKRERFASLEGFVSTLSHELVHSTAHASRLNRTNFKNRHGTPAYASEELVAEIGSVFLTTALGLEITDYQLVNHKAYVKSWAETIRNKPEALFRAIVQAEKATDYIKEKGNYNTYLKAEKKILEKEKNLSQERGMSR